MSHYRTVNLRCDNCFKQVFSSTAIQVTAARDRAAQSGWKYWHINGARRDYCPHCAAEVLFDALDIRRDRDANEE